MSFISRLRKPCLFALLAASTAAAADTVKTVPLFSPYKDTTINMDWNTNVVSTMVTGQRVPLVTQLLPNNHAVTLAFATGVCGEETWGGVNADAFAQSNLPLLKDKNINYIISTGGAAGTFSCDSVTEMKRMIDRYRSDQFVGIDFDVEADTGKLEQLIQTTAQVQKQYYPDLRVSLTLATMAAPGSTVNVTGDKVIKAAQTAGLNFVVNLMVMDYGQASPMNCQMNGSQCDMAASAIFAAKEFSKMYNIPLSRIELTAMIGDNDTRDETFSLQDVEKVAHFAKESQLAGLHYWSFDRDVGCNPKTSWASPICNNSSEPGQALQFDKVFLQALGM